MKIPKFATALALLCLPAYPQGGSLTPPPGPPGATMKPLDVVEPRIPLIPGAAGVSFGSDGDMIITQPGSYYLTRNLVITTASWGIAVAATGVTLDLMGHSISYAGTGTPDAGILIDGHNVTVHNGHVLSTTTFGGGVFTPGGFNWGVYAYSSRTNVSVRNLSVRGVRGIGIQLGGNSSLVEQCTVAVSAGIGIRSGYGSVTHCAVQTTGTQGILSSTVSHSTVENALGAGIAADTVLNCFARSTGTTGYAIFAKNVSNSHGTSAGFYGIQADHSVTGSTGVSTSTEALRYGIYCPGLVSTSRGEASGGHGIFAGTATDSTGISTGANGLNSSGIFATQVIDSTGTSTSGHGISASRSIAGSSGQTTATASGRHGIDGSATGLVSDSTGSSAGGHGIYGSSVTGSRGDSSGIHGVSSCGIFATARVEGSHGDATSTAGGDGINCFYIVTGSSGRANTGSRHGIICWLATHSFGYRATDETAASKYGISATQAVGCRSIFGQFITDKFDMP